MNIRKKTKSVLDINNTKQDTKDKNIKTGIKSNNSIISADTQEVIQGNKINIGKNNNNNNNNDYELLKKIDSEVDELNNNFIKITKNIKKCDLCMGSAKEIIEKIQNKKRKYNQETDVEKQFYSSNPFINVPDQNIINAFDKRLNEVINLTSDEVKFCDEHKNKKNKIKRIVERVNTSLDFKSKILKQNENN